MDWVYLPDYELFGKENVYNGYLLRKVGAKNTRLEIYSKTKRNNSKKNVVVLHLESLSTEIFSNKFHSFPILNELMEGSLRLTNFYTSAASSGQALISVFFGNDFEYDSCPDYDKKYSDNFYQRNMYDILQENGYNVLGIGYHEFPEDEINKANMWPLKDQKYEFWQDYLEFHNRIHDFIMSSDKPFALHVWNVMPQLGHSDSETRKGATFLERLDISYTSLDMTIEFVLNTLKEKDAMDDTVIIGYGDHGDDKWTRSLNKGYTHLIEPYRSVINTPAFIYDSRIGKGLFNDMVSAVDIKNTALFLVGIDNNESFPYQGINIFESRNEIVYAQSLLANQRQDGEIKADWVKRLNNFSEKDHKNKAYCAVNENYNLLVGDHGMEFFMHGSEPWNYNNLLDFFEINENGKIVKFNNHGAWRGHLRLAIMADDQIFDIMQNYYQLRKALIERITVKHSMIREDAGEKNLFDMSAFNRVRPRGYIWE